MLTVGSLFAGIGGFDLGLERAGMRSVWQCEIDPYAIRVLEKHWPHVLRVRDVRDVGPGTVPRVDVICGGFPCQDLSVAGAGAGLDGTRSGLWWEYARVVGELRPRYVIVENVPGLLARGMGRVLGELAALGYDAEWDCIPAAALGAPHIRDRVWIVAYPGSDELREQQGRGQRPGGTDQGVAGVDGEARYVADATLDGRGSRGSGRPDSSGAREPQSALQDVADANDAGRGERWRAGAVRAQQPSAERGREMADAGRGGGTPGRPIAGDPRGSGAFGDADGSSGWAVEPDVGRVAHGVPARVDRLRCLGNALVPQIAEWIGRRILEWEGLT